MGGQIAVGLVVPVEISGMKFVFVGELDDIPLVVERAEWEDKRPKKARMKCFYWDGVEGRLGKVTPAPDLVPQGAP